MFTSTITLLLITSTLVAAQLPSDIPAPTFPKPACFDPCLQGGISQVQTGCSSTDFTCLCGNADFEGNVQNCVMTTCASGTDQDEAVNWYEYTCEVGAETATETGASSTGPAATPSPPISSPGESTSSPTSSPSQSTSSSPSTSSSGSASAPAQTGAALKVVGPATSGVAAFLVVFGYMWTI